MWVANGTLPCRYEKFAAYTPPRAQCYEPHPPVTRSVLQQLEPFAKNELELILHSGQGHNTRTLLLSERFTPDSSSSTFNHAGKPIFLPKNAEIVSFPRSASSASRCSHCSWEGDETPGGYLMRKLQAEGRRVFD